MTKQLFLKYSLVGAFAITLLGCQQETAEDSPIEVETVTFNDSQIIPDRYIIVYKGEGNEKLPSLPKVKSLNEYHNQISNLKSVFVDKFKSIGLKKEDVTATYGYALQGFAANLTPAQLSALKIDPKVQSIEQDQILQLGKPANPGGGGGSTAQVIPYGTTRVNGGTTASTHTAWVIDSGINLDHPDLNVDVARSVSFLTGSPSNLSPEDQNGHGTHVAGTIAALNNGIGSVGVAPGTLVVAVRVLDRRGSGSLSGVIDGIDYVAASGSNGDVANMSLGGGVSVTLDNAVKSAAATGVKFALAAGNESDDSENHSPARADGPNIYTISAMNSSDNWASFSNYGSHVDYCAPGVGVYSTWKNGGYNTISGTSMASPHAAGVLLLGIGANLSDTVNGDPDGDPDIIIHL